MLKNTRTQFASCQPASCNSTAKSGCVNPSWLRNRLTSRPMKMKLRCFTGSNFPFLRSSLVQKTGQNDVSAHFYVSTQSCSRCPESGTKCCSGQFFIRVCVSLPEYGRKSWPQFFHAISFSLLVFQTKFCSWFYRNHAFCLGNGLPNFQLRGLKTDFQITWQKPRLEVGVIKLTVKTLSGSRQ
jgi:hypothetical protein